MIRPSLAAGAAGVAAALLATGLTTAPAARAAGPDDPAEVLRLGAEEKLIPRGVITDPDGTVHTRYERTYDGLPVLGGDLVVHRNRSGKVEDVDKATEATIKVPTVKPSVAPPAARRTAMAAAPGAPTVDKAPRKVIWAASGKPVLAYETVVGGRQKDGSPSRLHVITDATTGRKLFSFEALKSGVGTGQYNGKVTIGTVKAGGKFLMKDTARGGHVVRNAKQSPEDRGPLFTNATDTWGNGKPSMAQTAAVDAQYGAAMTWDYYLNVHKRKGIRGNGKAAYSIVHYRDRVWESWLNAQWDDDCFCMRYGDGLDGKYPFTELDLAAHEMTHGVTSATAGLLYSGESGALDEATSDILGTAVEFYAENPKAPANYLIGERVNFHGDNKPLRSMDKPSKDGHSADSWSRKFFADPDYDVHYGSGIGNHFFYLLAEGSGKKTINGFTYNSPTADGKKVTGIGRAAAEKIWYKALTAYMTSTTNYKGARSATLKAARDLFGTKSGQYRAVQAAWDGVNVK
ncbi:M4 family metallopeptidase [Streptomyces caatingaensis]|uniref:M4 family metallopeptidase n=1 Tax=Streptomyces caatingaensis TaxID=1678637 RepID=UPI000AD89A25|nr:M4 family metallopeptidase [Streptomyces caatingaensis]